MTLLSWAKQGKIKESILAVCRDFKNLEDNIVGEESITLAARAKINLALDVVGKLENGYHLVQMVMQTIGLADRVRVALAKTTTLFCDAPEVPQDESNLAFKAWQLLQKAYALPDGVAIHIQKQIPLAGGLAGGSTDAAAVLWAVNRLYDLQLPLAKLAEFALQLGADVPFCLTGGTQLAEDIGQKLTPLSPCPELQVLVVNPGFPVNTGQVYQTLRWQQVPAHPDVAEMCRQIQRQDQAGILTCTGNVLEYATFQLFPQLARLKQEIAQLGLVAMMSGSGGTMLGLAAEKQPVLAAAQALKGKYPVVLTTVTDSGRLENPS